MKKFNENKTKKIKYVNSFLKLVIKRKEAKNLLHISECQRILVFDFDAIGDIVMLIPFLRVLRRNASKAQISLVCRPHAKDVLEQQGLVDEYFLCDHRWFSSFKALLSDVCSAVKIISRINKVKYNLALEPRGDLRDIFFMHFCNADRKAAYTYTGGEYMLTDPIEPSQSVEHLIEDKMYFLRQMGCEFKEEDSIPRFHLLPQQEEDNRLFCEKYGINGKVIVGIHPGASMEIKRWKSFPELLSKIYTCYKNVFFLIFSESEELKADSSIIEVARSLNVPFYNVNTNLTEYIQRLAICDTVICNDSSAGHIAAAFGIDVHVIFGPVMPELAKPYSFSNVYVYENRQISCRPCNQKTCNHNMECLNTILVDEVFEGVKRSLD